MVTYEIDILDGRIKGDVLELYDKEMKFGVGTVETSLSFL